MCDKSQTLRQIAKLEARIEELDAEMAQLHVDHVLRMAGAEPGYYVAITGDEIGLINKLLHLEVHRAGYTFAYGIDQIPPQHPVNNNPPFLFKG